ncbi:MAG: PEP-CTERM sorting domain-containing protein [Rubrivivax sp.]|nr:PEP-CTERM sorting domain-containing protein [Rubrivivax sp.]MDP3086419.1 PEP-CTERM sorting domain-containing protein [Rubrivivax sp.]
MSLLLKSAIAISALTIASTGHAALGIGGLPFGSLEFVQRVASAAPGEKIDVWLRFTLDPLSTPLDFSSDPLTGFMPDDLPTEGDFFDNATQTWHRRAFDQIDGAHLNTWFSCSDSFTGGCNGDTVNYRYDFFTSSEPGKPAINFVSNFSLAAGASTDYVFAQFTPAAGGAQAGTYRFYGTGLTLNFYGTDIDGNYLTNSDHVLGQTCSLGDTDSCAFTRSVAAIPEPASYGLMALGLLVVGASVRRRRG